MLHFLSALSAGRMLVIGYADIPLVSVGIMSIRPLISSFWRNGDSRIEGTVFPQRL
jgi:hypothetical protein